MNSSCLLGGYDKEAGTKKEEGGIALLILVSKQMD